MSGAAYRLAADAATGVKARALKRLALLPVSSTGRGLAVPFLFRDKAPFKAGLTDAEINEFIRVAPIEDVHLGGLDSIQHSVRPDEVRRYIVAPGAIPSDSDTQSVPQDVPIILERAGVLGKIVWNGNHRCTAAYLRGESTIRARLVKLPAASPTP